MTDNELFLLSALVAIAALAGTIFGYLMSCRGYARTQSIVVATVLADLLLCSVPFTLVLLGVWTIPGDRSGLVPAILAAIYSFGGILVFGTLPALAGSAF